MLGEHEDIVGEHIGVICGQKALEIVYICRADNAIFVDIVQHEAQEALFSILLEDPGFNALAIFLQLERGRELEGLHDQVGHVLIVSLEQISVHILPLTSDLLYVDFAHPLCRGIVLSDL